MISSLLPSDSTTLHDTSIPTYRMAEDARLSISPRSDRASENVLSSSGVKSAGLPFTVFPLIRWYSHWRDFPK